MTGPALADWFKVDESNQIIAYIDPTTIRKDGNLRRVWVIHDLKQPDENGALSFRARQEFDCKQERSRTLSLSTHRGQMAEGGILLSLNTIEEWADAPPKTIIETVLQAVCGVTPINRAK